MKMILALCLVLAVGVGCRKKDALRGADAGAVVTAPPVGVESEPNDRPAQATPLIVGRPVRGRLAPRGKNADQDYFRIEQRAAKDLLRAEVTGIPGADIELSVYRAGSKKRLARANNGGRGAPEVIPNLVLATGSYVIRVRPIGRHKVPAPGSYTLTLTTRSVTAADEIEPNDVRVDAQPIKPSRVVHGYFGRRRDVDWYKLELPPTQGNFTLRVEMTAVPGVAWASLRILDEIEAVLKKGNTGRRTSVLFPNLYLKPKQRILYLVASSGRRYNVAERYSIQATLEKITGPGEREPNDRRPLATVVRPGEVTKGYLAPSRDVDWYALEVSQPSMARVSVTGVDGVDLVLSFHDASGKRRLRVDDGKKREGEILPNVPLPKGRSLLRLAAYKRWQENVFQAYQLVAMLRPDPGNEEREPNEKGAQANPLGVGRAVRGLIYPRKDQDWYRFDVVAPPAQKRGVRFDLKGVAKVRLKVRVLDSAGTVVAKAGPSAPYESLALTAQLAAGRYHVHVSGSGKRSNPRDFYELRGTLLP